jgi:Spy/CpxP family protein refolding chaperone
MPMKKIARTTVLAALLSAGFTHLQANEKVKTPEQRQEMVQKKVDRLSKKLKLTADQQSQIQTIMQDKIDKKQQILDEANAKIRALLTPEQLKKYNDLMD